MATKLSAFMASNPNYGPVEALGEMLLGEGSWDKAAAISTSDTVDLPTPSKAIYVGVAGDIKVDLNNTGTAIVFKAVPVGLFKIQAKRVYATGTAATNMVNLY